jgi:hypothetical protein
MTARLILAALLLSLAGAAWWGINTAAEHKAQVEQRDAAIGLLSSTMREMQERRNATDKLLAETARRRDEVQRSAARLARELAAADAADHCPGADISAAVADRVREYRTGISATGSGAADLD